MMPLTFHATDFRHGFSLRNWEPAELKAVLLRLQQIEDKNSIFCNPRYGRLSPAGSGYNN